MAYGAPVALGNVKCDPSYIKNLTSGPLTIDVVRLQDVDAGSGWSSSICLDLCYFPSVDSVQLTIPPNDSTPLYTIFYITDVPDSQTVYFKVKNVNTPTEVGYQRFHGVTIAGYIGIQEYANLAHVSIYPSPVVAGNVFNMNITNVKAKSKEYTLLVYNIYGGIVSTIYNMKEGNNALTLQLAPGVYSYNLVSGDTRINSGTFSISK